jgi:hypothetical protein
MEEWGNARANQYYEANIPSHVTKPKDGDPVRVVEKFIRDKYEHKKFIAREVPPKVEYEVEVEEDKDVLKRRTGATGLAKAKNSSKPSTVSAAVNPPPAEAMSLIDFMDDVVAPVPPAQQQFQTGFETSFNSSGTDPFQQQQPVQQMPQQSVSIKF